MAAKIWWQWQASNGKVQVKNGTKNAYPTKSHGNTDQWQTMQEDNGQPVRRQEGKKAEDVKRREVLGEDSGMSCLP